MDIKKRNILLVIFGSMVFFQSCTTEVSQKQFAIQAATAVWPQGKTGYEAVLEQQKKTKEPVLVYFSTVWCGYCRRFERNILSVPKVVQGLSTALKVHLDAEVNSELAGHYQVSGIPRIFILYPDGRRLPVSSSSSSDEFLAACRRLGLNVAV